MLSVFSHRPETEEEERERELERSMVQFDGLLCSFCFKKKQTGKKRKKKKRKLQRQLRMEENE